MSPASKHNRYGKGGGENGSSSEQAPGKEWKASKVSSSKNSSLGSLGMSASAYNPGTGMFHMLDSSISEALVSNHSGSNRGIRSMDGDTEDMGSVVGSYSEYDSVSNNGSCSGESEDQLQNINGKDKKGQPPGLIGGGVTPGGGGSDSKRDKIRYKNEKKHQRQKERRAQDLRDRCTGILMSRKLEALALQLVAMGFSPDRATMALIVNEGHVEQSVAWLLEGGEGQVKEEDWNAEGPLKIDISQELARISDLELRLKYLRVEIDRAIVACEGDIDKACEWLHERYPRSGSGPPLVSNSTAGTPTPTPPEYHRQHHNHYRHAIIPPEEEGGGGGGGGGGGQRLVAAPSYLMTATGRGNGSTNSNNGGAATFYPQASKRPPLGLALARDDNKEPPISYAAAIPQTMGSQGYQSILSRHPHPHLGGPGVNAAAPAPPGRAQGGGGVTDWHRLPPSSSNNVLDGKVMYSSGSSSSNRHPTQQPPGLSYPTSTTITTNMPQGRHQAQLALDSRGVLIPHGNNGGGGGGLPSHREHQGPPSSHRHSPAAMITPQSPLIRPSFPQSASVSPSLSSSSWHGNTGAAAGGAGGSSSSPSSVLYFNGGAGASDMLYNKEAGNLSKQQQQQHTEELSTVQPHQLNRGPPAAELTQRQGVGAAASGWSNGSGTTSFGVSRDNAATAANMSATAAAAPSTSHVRSQSTTPKFLSGWGSGLPGGPADWNMWVSSGCDYRNIDWSMGGLPSSSNSGYSATDGTGGIWGTAISFASMLGFTESGMSGLAIASEGLPAHPQSGGYSGGVNRELVDAASSSIKYSAGNHLWRSSNGSGSISDRGSPHLGHQGIQENLLPDAGNSSSIGGAGVAPEWTSPFAGKDLFTLPHQAVPSPLL